MNGLMEVAQGMADAVASGGERVARVEGRRRLPASGLVWSTDGVIVTANHVVRRDEDIQVGLAAGSSVSATLVGRDPSTDLAILQVEGSGLTAVTEASKNDIAVGHFVLALGRLGKSVQATLGVISALGDSWRTRGGGMIDHYLQTDVIMYPGFSGGALINAHGHLVGLNSSHLVQGISVAVPTVTIARVVDSLLTHGHVKRGHLGVSTQRVRLPHELRDSLGQKYGLLIVSVEADGPAVTGGLTMGDTIVGVGDTAVSRHDQLVSLLTSDRVGQATPLKVVRTGQVQTVDVVIGERP